MGKRTSDFIALAAILGGAGLGLGLTSLYARSAPVAQVDDVSVEVRVVPGRVLVRHGSVRPTIYFRNRARANRLDWAPLERPRVNVEEAENQLEELRRVKREITRFDREQVERLRTQVQELRLEAGEMADFESLFEALEGLEALQDLDLENLAIDVRRDEEDQRRRRRRRRPPR